MANNTYVDIADRAIRSFNSIFNAMSTRGALLSAAEKDKSTPLKVDNYGARIERLTYIASDDINFSVTDTIDLKDTVVGLSVGATGVKYTEAGLSIQGVVDRAGYYRANTTGAKVTLAVTPYTFNVDGADKNFEASDSTKLASYTYTPSDGEIIGAVTVGAGSYDVKVGSHTVTATNTLTAELKSSELAAGTYEVEQGATSSLSKHKEIKLDLKSVVTGKSSSTAKTTFTKGYIDKEGVETSSASEKIFGTETDQVDLNKDDTVSIFIKEGSISLALEEGKTAKAGISNLSGVENLFTTSSTEGLAIKASVAELPIAVKIESGYVEAGTALKQNQVTVSDETLYIRKGKIEDQTVTAEFAANVTDNNSVLATGDQAGYEVTVSLNEAKAFDKTAEVGFIAENTSKIYVNGSKTIKVKKGSASTSAKLSSYTVTSGIATKEGATGDYEIEIVPTVVNASTTTAANAGFITADDVTAAVAEDSLKSLKAYVAAGSIGAATQSFNITETEVDGDGTIGSLNSGIFFDNAPEKGDYFTLTTSHSRQVTTGYIEGQTITDGYTKYMPKAVFEWKKDEDGNNEYLHVKTGGYLPSGKITEIATVEENNAIINLAADASDFALVAAGANETEKEGYYSFAIKAASVDAGYISQTQGTINGKRYFVKKGSVYAKPTVTFDDFGEVEREVGAANAVSYKLPINVTAGAGLVAVAGHILETDINKKDVEQAITLEATLPRAEITSVAHSTTVEFTSNVVAAAENEEDYLTVTPVIKSCSTQLKFSEGYITADAADTLTNNVGAHDFTGNSTYKIHRGKIADATLSLGATSGLSVTGIEAGKITVDAESGKYSLPLAGKINATAKIIDAGYYVANAEVTKEQTVSADNFVVINAGSLNTPSIDVVDTVTLGEGDEAVTKKGIYSETVELHDANTESGKTFMAIKVQAAVSSSTTANEGYIKDGTSSGVASHNYGSTKYIETYTTGEHVIGEEFDEYVIPETPVTESASMTIETAGKYVPDNITVTLADDAMGKNVINKMLELEKRLDGYFA